MSPTQRSLKMMRERGYLCAITEHWNPFAKIRQDLFGFIDILCVGECDYDDANIICVQTTTLAHQPERVAKIKAHPHYEFLKKSALVIVVHGWRKLKTGWECREIEA